jgi:RES domain-containing protein
MAAGAARDTNRPVRRAARGIGANGSDPAVPSVALPGERNVVINPAHRDFDKVTVASTQSFAFDPRRGKRR